MVKRYFILIAFIASSLFSCKDFTELNDNEYVNNWIYNEMSVYYLWNTKMPGKPNYNLTPDKFFESLLYNKNEITGDRFSWIQENFVELLNLLSGVTSYDIGFEYVGYRESETSTAVIGEIAYVKPGTNAEEIGLKRGDRFTKVNGTPLNTTNWRSLLSGSEASVTITFSDKKSETDIIVKKAYNYAEDPVFFNEVYEVSGHKIGYLVYNFFASGPSQNDYQYDKELNDVFAGFKSANITELVLDLRYNSGGSMNSATQLASMIVPNLNAQNVFTKLEYNSLVQAELIKEYGQDVLVDKLRDKLSTAKGANTGEAINNIGGSIQKLYVLTGNWTASASELVINGLESYMPGKIFLIGNTTVGKNVGSISIYEENDPKNKWGMQPIILRYFNKDGNADFLNGFKPNIEEKDSGDKLPLGDSKEQMLKIAISHITGDYVATSTRAGFIDRLTVGSSVEQKAWANKTIVDGSLLKQLKR